MDYNDFKLPDKLTINKMIESFNLQQTSNKTFYLNNIFNLLSSSISSCLNIKEKYNNTIKKALENNLNNLIKIQENMSANFKIKTPPIHIVNNFNLFEFISIIINIILEFNNWNLIEDKIYYKKIISSQINILLNSLKETILSLKNSNIKFFKYM